MPHPLPSDWTAAVPDGDGMYALSCSSCGDSFQARRYDARFCSTACRSRASRDDARSSGHTLQVIAARCEACGGPLEVQTRGRRSRFCSTNCRQLNHRVTRRDAPATQDASAAMSQLVRLCASEECTTAFVVTHSAQRFCLTHRAPSAATHQPATREAAAGVDAVAGRCAHCREALTPQKAGRPRRFCSTRCRKANHRMTHTTRLELDAGSAS